MNRERDPAQESDGEPEQKKKKKEDRVEGGDEDGEEEGSYRLFVVIGIKKESNSSAAEEEDIGSDDDEEEEEEEEEREGEEVTAMEWSERLFSDGDIEEVKKMSSKIYDRSSEGSGEIERAVVAHAAATDAKVAFEPGSGREIVAMLVLREKSLKRNAEITQLFVKPDHRDEGIGRILVEYCLDWVKESTPKCDPLPTVECFAVGGSSGFYKRVGFVAVDRPGNSRDRCEMVFQFK